VSTDRIDPPVKAYIFLDGKQYAYRAYHSCPRMDEFIGIGQDLFKVYRVVHLDQSKDAAFMRWQEVDIYVNRDQPS
jgi:hypothetical protein